jgi:hypothetical protein
LQIVEDNSISSKLDDADVDVSEDTITIISKEIDSMEGITIDTDSKFIQFTQLVDIMKEFIDQFKPYPYYQNKPIQTLEVFNTLLEKFNSYVYSYFLGEPKNDYKYLDAGNPPPDKEKIAYHSQGNRTDWNTYVNATGTAIRTGGGNRKTRSVKHKKYRTTRRKGKVRNRLTRRK